MSLSVYYNYRDILRRVIGKVILSQVLLGPGIYTRKLEDVKYLARSNSFYLREKFI